jgi:hypothetical protein
MKIQFVANLFLPKRKGNTAILPMDFVKKIQHSGHFPSLRTVIAECEKIEQNKKKNKEYNFLFCAGHREFILAIQDVVTSYQYEEMAAIMQMLSYSPREINQSTIRFYLSSVTFLLFVFSVIFTLVGFGDWRLTAFMFLVFIICLGFHYILYYKIDSEIGFLETFKELKENMDECNREFERYFKKVVAFENQIDEIKINSQLSEEVKRNELEVKRNLLALNYEMLDFEFDKGQQYKEGEANLNDKIQNLKNNTEIKRLREELDAKGLTGKDQRIMAFMEAIKAVLVEEAKAVSNDINEKRNLLTKIQLIANAESVIEQYGVEGLGKIGLKDMIENWMVTGELQSGNKVNTTATTVEEEVEELNVSDDWEQQSA